MPSPSAEGELEAIRGELERLRERIDDLALGALRDAVEAGEDRRPELERRLTRARNALVRAIGALGGLAEE